MSRPLSPLGAIHTAISLIPVVAGLYSYARFRRIEPGKVYLAGLVLSVLTSFGLSSTGGFNPGHALGIIALLAAFGGVVVSRLPLREPLKACLAAFGVSFSFFLLIVPAINETLTRLPTGHPLAHGPDSPTVQVTLVAWLALFITAFVLQVRALRSTANVK